MCRRAMLLGLVSILLCNGIGAAVPVEGEGPRGEATVDAEAPPRDRPWATGDWGGFRRRLERTGFVFLGTYTFDHSTVMGGTTGRGSAGRGLISVGIGADLMRLLRWKGASAFAAVHALRGANGSSALGDVQGYSNIDAEEFGTLAEVWFQQVLLSDRLRFKLGRVDANTEFAWVGAGAEFINSSAGFSPTIQTLPTYPDPAPSINVFYRPVDAIAFGVGLYERTLDTRTRSRARFAISEVRLLGEGSRILGPWRLALGAWHDGAETTALDGGIGSGTSGLYALGEQRFVTSPSGRWIDVFAQLGHADQTVGELANHWSLGIVTSSPLRGRGRDLVGAMVSSVDLSDASAAGFRANEDVLEVFYSLSIVGFLRVKPDLQYVSNPAGVAGSALVGTLRVELAF